MFAFYCIKDHPKYKQALIISEFIGAKLFNTSDFDQYKQALKHGNTQEYYEAILTWCQNNTGDYCLAILDNSDKLNKFKKYIYIDYINQQIAGQDLYKLTYSDALPKALGLANYKDQEVSLLDGTAGLTIDSYGLYRLHQGIQLTLIEQSKVIYSLIRDALERLESVSHVPSVSHAGSKIKVFNYNLLEYLQGLNKSHNDAVNSIRDTKFDLIYLDPMFEQHSKAKPKKNMQLLQDICTNPESTENLLKQALMSAKDRVVLKRARTQAKLLEQKINFSVTTKQLRYDVYLA